MGHNSLENWALMQFPRTADGGPECQHILRTWFTCLKKQVDPATAEYGQHLSEAVQVLEAVREAISGMFWLDLLDEIRDRPLRPTDWWRLRAWIALFKGELTSTRRPKHRRPSMWAWPTQTQIEEWAYRGTGRAGLHDLEQALAAYLKRPWLQSDAIDVSSINALLVTELAEVHLAIRNGAAFGKPNWGFVLGGSNVFVQMVVGLVVSLLGFLAMMRRCL